MLERYLAEMYRVETRQLKRQLKRNIGRFPKDFMFELTTKEFENLRSQISTSSWGRHKAYADGFFRARSSNVVQYFK